MTRLTLEDVNDIRFRATLGQSNTEIAAVYSIARDHVSDIVHGHRWGWSLPEGYVPPVRASGGPLIGSEWGRYECSGHNRQAGAFLNRPPATALAYATWARRRGYSEERIAAEEARIAPPVRQRHLCQPGTVCCAAVEGYVAHAVDEAAD